MARSEAEVKKEISKPGGKVGIHHVAMILVTDLVAAFLFAFFYSVISGKGWQVFPTAYAISVIAFLPVSYLLVSVKFKCKNCESNWACEETHTETIDSYIKTKRERMMDGASDRYQDVQYRVTNYWQYSTCNHCSNVTRERKKREDKI